MKKLIATLVVLSLIAALAIAASTAGGSERAQAAATKRVGVADDVFMRGDRELRPGYRWNITRGTKFYFVWTGDDTHNVTGLRRGREVFQSRDTDETGFRYPATGGKTIRRDTTVICTIHPSTMRIRLNVR